MGDKLEWFISLQNEGNIIPILEEQPELLEVARPYWKAYNLLACSRRIGMASGMIPLTEIVAYCDLILLDHPDDRLFLVDIITDIDSFYISKMSEKQEKEK